MVLFFSALLPTACGESRDQARVAALEAGIASAQASLAILSGTGAPTPSAPPFSAPSNPVAAKPVGLSVGASSIRSSSGARPLAVAELLGAGPDALRRWFGDPDLRRPESDAEVQLFLGDGCALDVVLYADASAAKRVAHAAARADGPAAVTEAECLRRLGGRSGGGGGVGRAATAGHTAAR